jgi:hypothetical protein
VERTVARLRSTLPVTLMKFSENWLRELVDIPVDREALMHRLTMA